MRNSLTFNKACFHLCQLQRPAQWKQCKLLKELERNKKVKKDSTRISKTEKTRDFSLPSDGQFWNAAGEQPPPSLRSLYAQQSKKPAFSGQTAKSSKTTIYMANLSYL